MNTKQFTFNRQNDDAIKEAAALLRAGELVAFPTETVYGLGADATNKQAVEKIFEAKGRPSDNPLIVHVAGEDQLQELAEDVPEYVYQLIKAFSPGPITYVLKSKGKVAENVTAGLDTVGVRIPDHPAAIALIKQAALPIAAPSANISGRPSPTRAQHVIDDLSGKIAAVVDGGSAEIGVESTVIDCTSETPVILRLGQVTKEAIEKVVKVEVNKKKTVNKPKSPGTKYKHYMPQIPLILVNDHEKLQDIIDKHINKGLRVGALVTDRTAKQITANKVYLYGKDENEFAAKLYHNLRAMTQDEADIVIAEKVSTEQVGIAVMDRLQRAATEII